MAHSTCALSLLLVLVSFFLVEIEARESKFFTKAVVIHADTTVENVTHHVEAPAPSPSVSPSPAPVEAEINRGYGLYGRDETPNTSGTVTGDSLYENKSPAEEFEEKFGKDEFDNNELPSNYNEHSYVTVSHDKGEKFENEELSNNELPSNYNEHSYVTESHDDNKQRFGNEELSNNELPSNYNEHSYVTHPEGDNKERFGNEKFNNNELPSNYNKHSYVTVPRKTNLYDTKFSPSTNSEEEFVNNEEKLTPEEEQLFDQNSFVNSNANYFNDNHNHNSQTYNGNQPQGLSDTRTLENGKYHYALHGSPPKHRNEGYYGNNGEPKSQYEFDTMEEFERQEGYSQIPGEFANP